MRLTFSLSSFALISCMFAYHFSHESDSRGYLNITAFSVLLVYLFVCWTSEMIVRANSAFAVSLTDCRWYNLSPREERLFLMMVRRSQAQGTLTCYHHMLHVTYRHYTDVLRLLYKMINFMRTYYVGAH